MARNNTNKLKIAFTLITTASFLSVVNPESEEALKADNNNILSILNVKDLKKWDNQLKQDFGYIDSNVETEVKRNAPTNYNAESSYAMYQQNDFIATSVLHIPTIDINVLPETKKVDGVYSVSDEEEVKLLPEPKTYPQKSISKLTYKK